MTLVQLEGRNGSPVWVNPEHVVSVVQNHESNTYVGQSHTPCTEVHLGRISWIVRGEPEHVIEQLFGNKRVYNRGKTTTLAQQAAGSD